jgi:hypothetical protein
MIHGIKTFDRLRYRAHPIHFAGHSLRVACLADDIASNRAAGWRSPFANG